MQEPTRCVDLADGMAPRSTQQVGGLVATWRLLATNCCRDSPLEAALAPTLTSSTPGHHEEISLPNRTFERDQERKRARPHRRTQRARRTGPPRRTRSAAVRF